MKAGATTIAEQWDSFMKHVLQHIPVGSTQFIETKRAFYAGAAATLNISLRIAEPDISEAAGVAMFEGVRQELNLFYAELQAGRA